MVSPAPARPPASTYVVVDAENLDWAVSHALGRKPDPADRVQFDRLVAFAAERYDTPVRCIVVLNARGEQLPDAMVGFVRALKSAGCDVALLHGRPDQKVVDAAILKLLEAIRTQRPGTNVVLASHDGGDFAAALKPLVEDRERKVAVIGLREFVSQKFRELIPSGLEIHDLEFDVKAFLRPLPRLVPVRVEEFDPALYL